MRKKANSAAVAFLVNNDTEARSTKTSYGEYSHTERGGKIRTFSL